MNIILFDGFPEGGFIPASDERASHILNILHLRQGDSFKMGIINESEGEATIEAVSDDGITVSYKSSCKPALYPVTLLCAQVRPICMKRILREAVSLGVGRIILSGSDTGEKSYLSSNLYKTGEYREYLLDGAMQSAHAGLPE
ncbi:MAG: RsmE family RNA methyltransferase, partial [Spirochaetales bacterium]|nr:RsmE family RNA methyltransferase [Spirochaetales bacterium]